MGQFVEQAARDELAAGLAELGLKPDAEAIDRLLDFATELTHWSRRVNLTGAATADDLIRGPLFDALTLVPALDEASDLVDVGAGGGLPGIPAVILRPDIRLTLVEPRSRRTSFLRHALHALGIQGEVVQCREEELKDHQFEGAVAQAVWPAPEWLVRGPRLIVPGGALYCLTVAPIDPGDLPLDAVAELERSFTRPDDDAARIATRIRLP